MENGKDHTYIVAFSSSHPSPSKASKVSSQLLTCKNAYILIIVHEYIQECKTYMDKKFKKKKRKFE